MTNIYLINNEILYLKYTKAILIKDLKAINKRLTELKKTIK